MPQTFTLDNLLTHFKKPYVQLLPGYGQLDMLRLDEMHPVISGNKIFKLWYFLKQAAEHHAPEILTFGGAFSNHLAATALACKLLNFTLTAVIRGEKPANLSPTLAFCLSQGMHPLYVSRQEYRRLTSADHSKELADRFGAQLIIPEGGFSPVGAKGAALIAQFIPETYTHVVVAAGTATTAAGLLLSGLHARLIVVPVLKGFKDFPARMEWLGAKQEANFELKEDVHFGGYACKDAGLIQFINDFYTQTGVPLDFVYTAKMMFAIDQLLKKGHFSPKARILAIHTGGLQGNASIQQQLIF